MTKKGCFLLLLLLFVCISTYAQKNKRISIDDIKRDTSYYWGQSPILDFQDEAMEISINNLYENIANNCNANAIYAGTGEQKDQLMKIIATFEFKIKEKYSQLPLVEDRDDDRYSYFVYMKKDDFRTMCDERKNNIERLALRGYKSENDECLQLEDALKSYYWGMMLCIAHPRGNVLKIKVEGEEVYAYEWFYDRIDGADGVFRSFSFVVPKENAVTENEEGVAVRLKVRSSSGNPVANLQFNYNNGQKNIPTSVNDGEAVVFLSDEVKSKFNIKIEYKFLTESIVNPDVNLVLETLKPRIRFKNDSYEIDLSAHMNKKVDEKDIALGKIAEDKAAKKDEPKVVASEWRKIDEKFNVEATEYLKIMQEVEKAFRDKDYNRVKHHFTEEGFGMIDTLATYGRLSVIGQQNYKFLKFGNQVICRDINMQFDFRNNVSFNRDVVFRFDDKEKKIVSIAFRLSSVTENDILTKSQWPEESRIILVNFLEDYQTAYALKRFDYLESIYSDDALIIVGHVVKKTVIPDQAQFNLTEDDVRLMQYDKNTYFKNLARTFKSQEYINLRFADTEFTRASSSDNRDVYGVRLLQEYYSTTYGDIGYLFLLVDLSEDNPLIHVRAWQPDEVDLDKLMGIKDLRL